MGLLGACAIVACADTDASTSSAHVASEAHARAPASDAPLATPGDENEWVLEAQAYLADHGYLPAEERSADGRFARAIVADRPTPSVLDEATEQALFELQARNGLTPSGFLDAETYALMQEARCANSDVTALDRATNLRNKYALDEQMNFSTFRYMTLRVLQYPASATGLSQSEANAAIDAAASEISRKTGAEISRVTSGNADIDMYFYTGAPPSGSTCPTFKNKHLAMTVVTTETDTGDFYDVDLCVNMTHNFDPSDDSGVFDLQSVLLHEFGHAIGLEHSSVPGSVMRPNIPRDIWARYLSVDDLIATRAVHGHFVKDYGSIGVRDIAWSDGYVLWAISNTVRSGGYEIWKRSGSGRDQFGGALGPWVKVDGGAVRITVQDDTPWVVNSSNKIYRRNRAGTGWEQIAGCARDIGAGGGKVWVVGCEATAGGYRVYRFNSSNNTWSWVSGKGALRVAVDGNGDPWIVDDRNLMWEYRNSAWDSKFGTAKDLGSGVFGDIWRVGTDNTIYNHNDQAEVRDAAGEIVVPYRARWVRYPETGIAVAAPSSGEVSVIRYSVVYDIRDRYVN